MQLDKVINFHPYYVSFVGNRQTCLTFPLCVVLNNNEYLIKKKKLAFFSFSAQLTTETRWFSTITVICDDGHETMIKRPLKSLADVHGQEGADRSRMASARVLVENKRNDPFFRMLNGSPISLQHPMTNKCT